jgi:glycosyltransferase involved in cell wall biosynthesis
VDEVIVVNDASPETKAIIAVLEEYPSVKYICNRKNLGLAATRNVGVRAASGNIVCFLDADDELHPQKIELQWSFYHPRRAISCNVMRIGDERGTDRVEQYYGHVRYTEHRDSSKLVRRNRLTGASLMISRELFLSNGGYDETLRSCEDFDFWLRLLDARTPVFNIELPLYLYRINEQSLSRNLVNISYWELEVVKKYFARRHHGGARPITEVSTLVFWIFKHLVRCAQCKDPGLLYTTNENMKLLDAWPLTRLAILSLQKIGIPRLFGRILARRRP